MTEQIFLQNGQKTTIEPEKKSEGAGTKEKDDEKEGDTISQQEEFRKGQRKKTRISKVEKLQIVGASHINSTKLKAAAGEQKMPRTKIAQHKLPKENMGSENVAEVVDGHRKQEGEASQNVNILTDI